MKGGVAGGEQKPHEKIHFISNVRTAYNFLSATLKKYNVSITPAPFTRSTSCFRFNPKQKLYNIIHKAWFLTDFLMLGSSITINVKNVLLLCMSGRNELVSGDANVSGTKRGHAGMDPCRGGMMDGEGLENVGGV